MRIKFILSVLFIAGSLIAALWQKVDLSFFNSTPPTSVFTVHTMDGETMDVAEAELDPTLEEYESSLVTLDAKRGYFHTFKDLQEVSRIDVLEGDGSHLKITFRSGQVLEGIRHYKDKKDKLYNPRDYLCGYQGQLRVRIPFSDIISITRKENTNE